MADKEKQKQWRVEHAEQMRAYRRKWAANHREQGNATSRKWHIEHSEQDKSNHRKWGAAHRERERNYCAKWRTGHPEDAKASNTRWKVAHVEQIKAYTAKRYSEHADKLRVVSREYALAHPEIRVINQARRRAIQLNAPVNDLTIVQWKEIKAAHNHCCGYCQKSCGRLTQDHMIPLAMGGAHTANNIMPACQSCNSEKGTRTVQEWFDDVTGGW